SAFRDRSQIVSTPRQLSFPSLGLLSQQRALVTYLIHFNVVHGLRAHFLLQPSERDEPRLELSLASTRAFSGRQGRSDAISETPVPALQCRQSSWPHRRETPGRQMARRFGLARAPLDSAESREFHRIRFPTPSLYTPPRNVPASIDRQNHRCILSPSRPRTNSATTCPEFAFIVGRRAIEVQPANLVCCGECRPRIFPF